MIEMVGNRSIAFDSSLNFMKAIVYVIQAWFKRNKRQKNNYP